MILHKTIIYLESMMFRDKFILYGVYKYFNGDISHNFT